MGKSLYGVNMDGEIHSDMVVFNTQILTLHLYTRTMVFSVH